jgi:hypothetical protein
MFKATSKPGKKDAKSTKPSKKETPDSDIPPPEDEFGGGDFVSPVEATPTDDDKPLE